MIISNSMRLHLACIALLTCLLTSISAQAADSASAIAALQQRVQVLEDREAIRSLILAYGVAHDNRDYRTFAALFAREGEWVSGMGSAKGPEAIFTLMDDTIGHNPQPGGSGTFHILSNEEIKVEGDLASANTKWMYVTPDEDGSPDILILGHYLDEFIREDGVWKFLRREAPMNLPEGN